MKILIVSKSDLRGGTARTAYKLHLGLQEIGIDSKMIVNEKLSDRSSIRGPSSLVRKGWAKIAPYIDQFPLRFTNWEGVPFHLGWIGRDITKLRLIEKADIINLHGITGGFISIKGFAKIAQLDKPIIWTLHDMWAFTGGCHFSNNCKRYVSSCGRCPCLGSHKEKDLSRRVWSKKKKYFEKKNLLLCSPTKWLRKSAKKSSLLSNIPIKYIPHGTDVNIFKPVKQSTARRILNIPLPKKIILFGAIAATSDERKGFQYLMKSLHELSYDETIEVNEICVVIFGASESKEAKKLPFEVEFVGRLHDDYSLALVYNAADVFVVPSIQDNFPYTIVESFSCGTPVVGFNIGGIPEMIDHKLNGYIAKYKDSSSLAKGIKWILEDNEKAYQLGHEARKKALSQYSLDNFANNYKTLFQIVKGNI